MPPRFHVEVTGDLMAVRATGELCAEELIRFVKAHYPGFRGGRILWDLTGANASGLGPGDFVGIAAETRENTPSDVSRKTAYAVSDPAAYLLVWKYLNQVMSVRVPVEYHVFTDVTAAMRWLEQK